MHYFGFLMDIKEVYKLCNSNDIELIEDYCHGFLTRVFSGDRKILNTTKIYSLRKNIPITDGGAIENIKFNKVNISFENFFNHNELIFFIFRFFESFTNRIRIINLYSTFFQNFRKKIKNIKYLFTKSLAKDFKIRPKKTSYMLSRYISNNEYLNYSLEKRRNNYNFLFKEIKKLGLNIVLSDISNYSVPQFLPILLNKKIGFILLFK